MTASFPNSCPTCDSEPTRESQICSPNYFIRRPTSSESTSCFPRPAASNHSTPGDFQLPFESLPNVKWGWLTALLYSKLSIHSLFVLMLVLFIYFHNMVHFSLENYETYLKTLLLAQRKHSENYRFLCSLWRSEIPCLDDRYEIIQKSSRTANKSWILRPVILALTKCNITHEPLKVNLFFIFGKGKMSLVSRLF